MGRANGLALLWRQRSQTPRKSGKMDILSATSHYAQQWKKWEAAARQGHAPPDDPEKLCALAFRSWKEARDVTAPHALAISFLAAPPGKRLAIPHPAQAEIGESAICLFGADVQRVGDLLGRHGAAPPYIAFGPTVGAMFLGAIAERGVEFALAVPIIRVANFDGISADDIASGRRSVTVCDDAEAGEILDRLEKATGCEFGTRPDPSIRKAEAPANRPDPDWYDKLIRRGIRRGVN